MAIKYEIQEIKNSQGTGESKPFVRLRQGKAMTTDELADMIEKSCTATRSDVLAVMSELHHVMVQQLSMGNRFYLPEIGYMSLSVGSTPPPQKGNDKITGKDIYLRNVDFHPEKKLLTEIRRSIHFEKSADSSRHAEYTEEEIWAYIAGHLKDHRYITTRNLMSVFGLSRYKATKWLSHFVATGKLSKEATGRNQLYFLR